MKIQKLKLRNYRNCQDITLDLSADKNLIIGKNAQGKTNILESIYYLSHLKTHRTSNIKDLINFDASSFEVEADVVKSNTNINILVRYENSKKIQKVNLLNTTPKNFKTVLKTVLFSTEDLMLLRGSPSDRRNWLDAAISQIYPAYDDRLNKYDKVRIQKNNLLKSPEIDMNLLDVFNHQLVIVGSNIILLRQKFLEELKGEALSVYSNIAKTEIFNIEYSVAEKDINAIAESLGQELEARKSEEIARKSSCVGPHRDDVYFYIDGKDATKFASQGQQRTVVLALKLAEINLINSKTGESPILLLDDVLAELDDIRQGYLLETMYSEVQTIITSVDTLSFDKKFLKDVKIFSIQNGAIN